MSEVNIITVFSGKIDIVISSILPSLPPPRSKRHTSSATLIQYRPTKVARLPLRGKKRTVEWALPKHALLRGSSAWRANLKGNHRHARSWLTSPHPGQEPAAEHLLRPGNVKPTPYKTVQRRSDVRGEYGHIKEFSSAK